jgi:archaellum component FlaF (FlaF/FlaG flagellin family)
MRKAVMTVSQDSNLSMATVLTSALMEALLTMESASNALCQTVLLVMQNSLSVSTASLDSMFKTENVSGTAKMATTLMEPSALNVLINARLVKTLTLAMYAITTITTTPALINVQ